MKETTIIKFSLIIPMIMLSFMCFSEAFKNYGNYFNLFFVITGIFFLVESYRIYRIKEK